MTSKDLDGHVPAPPPMGRFSMDFGATPMLDPAFIAGIVNELYAEGRPAVETAPTTEGETKSGHVAAPPASIPAGLPPEASAQPVVFNDPVDWKDPRILMGVAEDFQSPSPTGLPGTLPHPAETENYYFLTPPVPAALPAQAVPLASRAFQVEAIRDDFPILQQTVHGRPLIWLDNAATTQKPRRVIEALSRFYERDNSNIHRGAHTLAARATEQYEGAREKVRRFLGASQPEEIVFVHGATEAINLVAQTYARKNLDKGDEIVLSEIEHHANIVPWQQVAREKGALLRVVPVNDRGEVLLEEYERLLGPRTRLVALAQVSNSLGTVLPVRTMTQLAHRHGARVLVDGAQSVPHMPVDVQALDCDFFAFSGHKLFAPTGIGVLYGKRELLEAMPPWQGGGNMIDQVTFEETTYQPAPAKFEAGTGILAGAVGLGAAIDYLDELGRENIARYEHELLAHGIEALSRIPGLRLIGTAADKASVLSFVLDGVRTEDVGRYLDQEGIAVRAGHHCAQPTMRRFGVASTVRPSLAFYNTHAEIDSLAAAVRKIKTLYG
jgi:cysteine desulfurase/selenocysteine lyase